MRSWIEGGVFADFPGVGAWLRTRLALEVGAGWEGMGDCGWES